MLPIIINSINDAIIENNDDFLLLAVGTTGSGKSMLMLHIMELYLKEKASVDFIGLDKNEFADALFQCKRTELPRFCANDEANISKREALSSYIKDTLDLYYSIRGKNIFHWWSNPSLEMIDKAFIKERIKGVIFTNSKHPDVRTYYYFTKEAILNIYTKYDNLNLNLLNKVKKKYALYKGHFKNYNGKLKQAYELKKDKRMDDKIDIFHEKYGTKIDDMPTGYITQNQLKKKLGCHHVTIDKYNDLLIKSGKVSDNDFKIDAVGHKLFSDKYLILLTETIKTKGKNLETATN